MKCECGNKASIVFTIRNQSRKCLCIGCKTRLMELLNNIEDEFGLEIYCNITKLSQVREGIGD